MDKNANKRIAKNTLALYARTLFTMLIGLYTSRVILSTLGETDYGIYSIVGGIVALSSFFRFAIGNAIQRYINFELGKNNKDAVNKIFCISFEAQFFICALIVLLGETIGLWFVNTQLNIPSDRMTATNWVYQLSILTCCIDIFRSPYIATIVSYEKMEFYAYVAVVESIVKLAIVYLLVIGSYDKLILFAVLCALSTWLINLITQVYCHKKLGITRFHFVKDKNLFKSIFGFASWNLLGHAADAIYKQGIGIVLNMFFGVAINAATGIATTVSAHVYTFVSNFQMAFKPQIIKTYAADESNNFYNIIYRSSKVSFFLLLILGLPLLLNIDFILGLWLEEVPALTGVFVFWVFLANVIDGFNMPLWYGIQANGNIKTYQIIISIIEISTIPIAYFMLKPCGNPLVVYVVAFFTTLANFIVRLLLSNSIIKLCIKDYFIKVMKPILLVSMTSIPIPLIMSKCIDNDWIKLLVLVFACTSISCAFIYLLGLEKNERVVISNYISKKINSLR